MGIDKDFQYNGHNSYVLGANEKFKTMPFFVQSMQHVTHSFFAMAPTVLASATRLKTLFFDAGGLYLSEQTHAFAVDVLWSREEITLTVPSGAHLAQLEFLGGASGWRFSEPKSEEGQTATPYNINYQGQLSKMTPTGVYTGFLHARNILLSGTQAEPGDRLDTELVKISNRQIVLENTVTQKTTRITSDGVYTGLISADQIVGGAFRAASPITFGPFTEADKVKVHSYLLGTGTLTEAEMKKYDMNQDGQITNTDKVMIDYMLMGYYPNPWYRTPTIRIEPASPTFAGGIFFGLDDDVDDTNSSFYMSQGRFVGRELKVYDVDAWRIVTDSIRSPDHLQIIAGGNSLHLRAGGNQLGIDSGGVYKSINGTKTYL